MATNDINETTTQYHNNKDLLKVLPAIIFLGTIMLIGLVGNTLVLYIYMAKLKPTTIRCFIIGLAVVDLSICLVDIPMVITGLRFQYTFGSHAMLCRILHMVQDFMFMSAVFLMLDVAAERYRKVCQPFKKQMTIKTAKITCAVSCALAAISCLPAYFIHGSRSVPLKGARCAIRDECSKVALRISYVFLISLTLCSTIILISLYSLIWYKVLRHLKSQNRRETLRFTETQQYSVKLDQRNTKPIDVSETDLDELDVNRPVRMHSLQPSDGITEQQENPGDQAEVMISAVRRFSAGNLGKTRSRDLGVSRMTRTIFWVTIVTVLTFLPILCGTVIELCSGNTLISLSYFHEIFMRSHYIQCAANPLLYSWFNTRFQYELKIMFNM